jgi:NAD-dependent deacetylase
MMTVSDFAEKIRENDEIVVFTGAGISTESGIPDFRSPGGIWTRYRPVTFQEYMSSEAARIEAWKRRLDGWEQYKNAKPNVGHYFVHVLDAKGKLIGLITQNVDGLHSEAGLPDEKIVELHGSNAKSSVSSAPRVTTPTRSLSGWLASLPRPNATPAVAF